MNPSIESIIGHRLYIMYVNNRYCLYKDDITFFQVKKEQM
jgi:hypothetical protein